MSARVARVLVLVGATAMTGSRVAAAVMCDEIGRLAPAVTTIFAAPNDTENTAWILRPDCSRHIEPLVIEAYGIANLNCSSRGIERIEGLPSAVERLHIGDNPIVQDVAVDLTKYSKLNHVVLTWCHLSTADNFRFPSTLKTLDLSGNHLVGIANGTIPKALKTLFLLENELTSLRNFSLPDELSSLNLQNNSLMSIDFTLPAGLVELNMDGNKIQHLENITMPSTLTTLSCPRCGVETFRGVQLSAGLTTLNLAGSRLNEFEVRDSDAIILKNVSFTGVAAQKTCEDRNATPQRFQDSFSACVISDAAFVGKYLTKPPSPTEAPTTPLPTSTPPSKTTTTHSTWTTAAIVIVSAVAFVALVLGAMFYWRWKKRPAARLDGKFRAMSMTESSASSDNPPGPQFLANDIRNDETFIAYRIAHEEVQIIQLIGKGGFGVIHLARFRGENVAIKKILPERAKDMRVVRSFMDEIRLCATLEHPHIVQFIGLMWSTLQDIAIVSEFMTGGDLHAALECQSGSSPKEWFEASANLKAKSSLALDVIVALVYLHSFDRPFIHRDLKAKNVLLNGEGDAKLSDFGTSREALLDETMTGEIGTVAWIAPEVLRGERYNEKADIYSLGVMLVELDTARHPYRKEVSETDSFEFGNAQIALLVSSGRLKPVPSPNCPPDVAPLIARCLRYDPQERPSAIEFHYQMRQVVKARSG